MARVLVVDDDEFARFLIKTILEEDGHEIMFAKDGMEGAVEALTPGIGLIVMDMNMPRMTGFEAIREIRALPQSASVPILVLAASDQSGDYEEAYRAGCDAYLSKPVDSEVLLERVKGLLDGKSPGSATDRPSG
jgi:CheY-like chemotaxis protein